MNNRLDEDRHRYQALERYLSAYDEQKGELVLNGLGITSDEIRWLIDRLKNLSGLNTLKIASNEIGGDGVSALATSKCLQRLHTLDVSNNGIGDAGVDAIIASKYLSGLNTLDISKNGISNTGAYAFAASKSLFALHTLILAKNHIGYRGAKALAKSVFLDRLHALDIGDNELGEMGGAVLVSSPNLSRLHTLDIGFNEIGTYGAEALVKAECLFSLRTLKIGGNDIRDPGAKALAVSKCLSCLESLDIRSNDISDGAFPLFASDHLTQLRSLDIGHNAIYRSGAMTLAASQNFSKLQTLKINNNMIGKDGSVAIAVSKILSGLHTLHIHRNDIGEEGAKALADSRYLSGLHTLQIGGNAIGDKGAKALSASKQLSGLRILRINENEITPEGAQAVVNTAYFSGLHILDIGGNHIRDEGAIALATSANMSSLHVLHIASTDIGDEGAEALAQSEYLSHLHTLVISGNKISEKGFKELAASRYLSGLHTCCMYLSDVGDEGAKVLANSEHLSGLHTIMINDAKITDPQLVIDICHKLLNRRLTANEDEVYGKLTIGVSGNLLRWPNQTSPISQEFLKETKPRKLAEILLKFKTDSTGMLKAGLSFAGRAMAGKTHAARWITASKSEFESLRRPIHETERTIGYDRYATTLTRDQHQQNGITDIALTVIDVAGQREQLNSVSNFVYMNARRSVFILVVKANETFKQDNWGDYYLQLIESLWLRMQSFEDGLPHCREDLLRSRTNHARIPVIMLIRRSRKDRLIDGDLPNASAMRASYPSLDVVVFDRWDAIKGDQFLPKLRKAIGSQLAKLPALREQVYPSTLRIRDAVIRRFQLDRRANDNEAPGINSMSVDDFRALCRSLEENSEGVQDGTMRELISLGYLAVAASSWEIRPDSRLLNPRFVNHYLFSGILKHGKSELKDGFMTNRWFRDLTSAIKDTLEIEELKKILKDCLAAFEWRHQGDLMAGHFVPDLLTLRPADEHSVWPEAACRITLKPKGFLNESAFFNFIADRKSDLRPAHIEKRLDGSEMQILLFRNECVMEREKCKALLKVDVIEQKIEIEVKGPSYVQAKSFGDGLCLVLREKIGSNLTGEWELPTFAAIVRSLNHSGKGPNRARAIMRRIIAKSSKDQERSWTGPTIGEWLRQSGGKSPGRTEPDWGAARHAITKLRALKLLEKAGEIGFRLTEHTGLPFVKWAAATRCLE